jgi:hypothetical protein
MYFQLVLFQPLSPATGRWLLLCVWVCSSTEAFCQVVWIGTATE